MKHTPTPWVVDPLALGSINTPDGDSIAQTMQMLPRDLDPTHAMRKLNAEFIVRACNAHDDLVEALKEAREYVERAYECAFPDSMHNERVLADIDSALAKAEGK